MTSFIISAHTNRDIPTEWKDNANGDCTFCRIIAGEMPSTRVYEDDKVIAILGKFKLSSRVAHAAPVMG